MFKLLNMKTILYVAVHPTHSIQINCQSCINIYWIDTKHLEKYLEGGDQQENTDHFKFFSGGGGIFNTETIL